MVGKDGIVPGARHAPRRATVGCHRGAKDPGESSTGGMKSEPTLPETWGSQGVPQPPNYCPELERNAPCQPRSLFPGGNGDSATPTHGSGSWGPAAEVVNPTTDSCELATLCLSQGKRRASSLPGT